MIHASSRGGHPQQGFFFVRGCGNVHVGRKGLESEREAWRGGHGVMINEIGCCRKDESEVTRRSGGDVCYDSIWIRRRFIGFKFAEAVVDDGFSNTYWRTNDMASSCDVLWSSRGWGSKGEVELGELEEIRRDRQLVRPDKGMDQ